MGGVTPSCVPSLQMLPDRDGKRCMFCVKTSSRTYEMSASDTRQRQEWTLGPCPPCAPSPASPCSPRHVPTDCPLPSPAIQTAIRLQAEGKKSLHKDLKQKRREQREQREQRKAAKEEETQRLKQLQEEKERKLQELELLKEAQRQAEMLLQEEEQRRRQQHEEMQRTLEIQLQEAEQVGASSWCVSCPSAASLMGRVLPSPSLVCDSPGGLEELLGAPSSLATMLLPPIASGLLGTVCDQGTRDGGVSSAGREIPEEQEMRTTCPGVYEAGGQVRGEC